MAAAWGVSAPLLQACGGGSSSDAAELPNVLEVAQATAELSTLVEALAVVGLTGAVAQGTVTVFAPTNAAFAALLEELGISRQALLSDKALLTQVLNYHLLDARVLRNEIALGKALEPLGGGFFKVEADSGLRFTDGRGRSGRITTTDILARNGVVHLVDRVLLPTDKDVFATAQGLPQLSVLVQALTAADLVSALEQSSAVTLFAPTNAAFATLLAELGLSQAMLFADKALLTRVLTYHLQGKRTLKADLSVGTTIPTLQGQTFQVGADLRITDQRGRICQITDTDVFAANGAIHMVDRVALPQ